MYTDTVFRIYNKPTHNEIHSVQTLRKSLSSFFLSVTIPQI